MYDGTQLIGYDSVSRVNATTYQYDEDGSTHTWTVSNIVKHPTDPRQDTFRVNSTRGYILNWNVVSLWGAFSAAGKVKRMFVSLPRVSQGNMSRPMLF